MLQEKSRNGADNKVKSPMPPRPSSRQPSRSTNLTSKSSVLPPIWRSHEKEEEKKDDYPSSTCRVLLSSHSFSPELVGVSQHYDFQLSAQKSHRRAQSWDAGDYSFWLSSANRTSNWSQERVHKVEDDAFEGHSSVPRDNEETSYQRNCDLHERPRSENSRASFEQLRLSIRLARNQAVMDNSWNSYKVVAQLLRRLAGLYFENEEFFASQATLEDALEMYQHVLVCCVVEEKDACLLDIADIICNLGSIELQHKNFELAIARFTEALDIQKGIQKQDHVKTIASLDNLGYCYSKCKSFDDALVYYKDMLNAQLLHYDTFNAECYETLGKQLVMYEKLDDWKGAAKAAKRALEKALNVPNVSNEYIDKLQRLRSEIKRKCKLWRR